MANSKLVANSEMTVLSRWGGIPYYSPTSILPKILSDVIIKAITKHLLVSGPSSRFQLPCGQTAFWTTYRTAGLQQTREINFEVYQCDSGCGWRCGQQFNRPFTVVAIFQF